MILKVQLDLRTTVLTVLRIVSILNLVRFQPNIRLPKFEKKTGILIDSD